jgi:hypothetical protein
MSRWRNPRCAACGRRVRRNQPYVIAVSGRTGKETYYHCRPKCQEEGVQVGTTGLKRGETYDLYSGVGGALSRLGVLLGAGLGLAALAGGFYLVYKRNKLVHDAVDRLVKKLKSGLAPELKNVKGLFNNFGKGVAGRIDDLGDVIVDVFDLRRKNKERKLKQFGKNAAVDFGLGVRAHAKSMDKDGSPGGKGITKEEMREVMKEDRGELLRVIRAAAAHANGSRAFLKYLDEMMSSSFDHFTGMKPAAR